MKKPLSKRNQATLRRALKVLGNTEASRFFDTSLHKLVWASKGGEVGATKAELISELCAEFRSYRSVNGQSNEGGVQ